MTKTNSKPYDDATLHGPDSPDHKNARESVAMFAMEHAETHEYARGFRDGQEDEREHARMRDLGARPGRRTLAVWTWRAIALVLGLAGWFIPTPISSAVCFALALASLALSEVAVIGRALEARNLLELEREDDHMEISGVPFPEPFVHATASEAETIQKAVEDAMRDGAIRTWKPSDAEALDDEIAEGGFQFFLRRYCGLQDPAKMRFSVAELKLAFLEGYGQETNATAAGFGVAADDLRPRFYTTGDRDAARSALAHAYVSSDLKTFPSAEYVDVVAKALGLERAL